MAVGAKDPEVLEPVVRVLTVDVVEFERGWLPLPLGDPASIAASRKQPFRDHAPAHIGASGSGALDQQLVSVRARRPGNRRPLAHA